MAKKAIPAAKQATPVPMEEQFIAFQAQLEGKRYRDVLGDLEAFTGFTRKEICARSIKKTKFGYGARGWFNEEFAYFNPRTPAEFDWFYRAGQIYLFSNARRAYWPEIDALGVQDQPILDYGAGIGQNVLEFYERGMKDAWYFELGTIQTEFFKFRMRRHGHEPKVIEPYAGGRFDTTRCLKDAPTFRTIIAQDVFEHIMGYLPILKALVGKLESGGKMVEHSPFARVKFNPKSKNERSTRVHLVDEHGLKKCMAALGMRLEKATVVNSKGSEVRTWTKT